LKVNRQTTTSCAYALTIPAEAGLTDWAARRGNQPAGSQKNCIRVMSELGVRGLDLGAGNKNNKTETKRKIPCPI